jgi:hypothetical protein
MLGVPAPAIAQTTPVTAPLAAAETVAIPFAPPLGTPFTYGLRFERKRASGDSVIKVEQQLTFERLGRNYLLRLKTLSFSNGGQRVDLADKRVLGGVPPALRLYFLPMTVELDGAGEMARMLDWEAMCAQLRELPEAVAALSGVPMDAASRAAFETLFRPIINGSAEAAPALMIRGWPAVLGYGSASFELGKPFEVETEVTGGMLTAAMPATMQGVLTRTAEGHLRLFQTTRFDPEAMREATLAVIETMRKDAQGNDKPAGEEALQAMQMTDELEIVFDPQTGLPISARNARLTSVTTGSESLVGGEIMTLCRISP